MRTFSSKSVLWQLWVGAWLALLVVAIVPVSNGFTRLAFMLAVIFLWAGGLRLFWLRRSIRWGFLALAVATFLVAILPGHPANETRLRASVTRSLIGYTGTRYVWGGEGWTGIDCSGLVRRGFILGTLKEGVATANPYLLRKAADVWWHDCSAEAMRDEYRSATVRLAKADSVRKADVSSLRPGDFAVTADGIHVLAYLGESRWIEADPTMKRVIVIQPSDDNAWAGMPVVLLRWRLLAEAR